MVLILVACGVEGASPSGNPTASSTAAPATPTPSPTPEPLASPPTLRLEPVADGLDLPSGIAVRGVGTIYVNETRSGLIRVINDGILRPEPFLDLSDRISGDGERGLLGFALHPGYESNGRVFVHYTRRTDGTIIVAEFSARRAGEPEESAAPESERILLTVEHPTAYHNGGQLAFGPDGFLYIGIGDGGSLGDVDGNAQNPDVLLGKILRLDVDRAADPGLAYSVPADNPYVGGGGAPEVLVLGLRNPWRFSFDQSTGDLWVADVGEGALEEVSRLEPDAVAGANLGWSVMEASICYNLLPCDTSPFIGPLTEYGRATGCAVIGGTVVRGEAPHGLLGWYLFGDYCEGTVFGIPAGAEPPVGELVPARILLETGLVLTAFGQAETGEVYVADFIGGTVYRIIADSGS